MVDIAREALRQYQELTDIIEDSTLIGGIYNMNYDDCTILSNDRWKQDAGGVPEHSYLLATSANWERRGEFDEDEAYAILLRAQGPAELENEQELREVRQKAMREMITGDEADSGPVVGTPEEFIDILTQNEIQYSGIKAKILGTFYQEDGELTFGSDIDTFYSSARYAVYKPEGEALSRIASFPVDPADEGGVPIGEVQYSSTQRYEREEARVEVDVEDFIGNKTAVFGMTRTGKSNTMKIIATAVYEHAVKERTDIGQLLFDPQGEYANPNQQDEMALAELGTDAVTIYRLGADGSDEGVEPLQINFFEEGNIGPVWDRINGHLADRRGSNYIENFLSAEISVPSSAGYGREERANRRQLALYATLARANFQLPDDFSRYMAVNQDVYDVIEPAMESDLPRYDRGRTMLHNDNLIDFWQTVIQEREQIDDADEDWVDADLEYVLGMFDPAANESGYTLLSGLRDYHNPTAEGDYAEKIYEELCDGKIAIVDMSIGTEDIVADVSERLVRHINAESVRRFSEGDDLPDIQIYLEEAHRLFDSDSFDDNDDPYVRLAKEGAKFDLGLIYATQEVTGVDRRVLANTANWVVTHLNNKNETNRLGDYYSFEDFKRPIREIEDKGFARIKMQSGEYIIPTQIDLFGSSRLEEAKATAQEYRESEEN